MTFYKINHETPVADFLAELNRNNIQLWVEGASLRYKAPKGDMSPEIMSFIKERKTELIQLLQEQAENHGNNGAIFYGPIPTAPVQMAYPLSSAQKRMFLLSQLNPEQTGYNLTQVLKLQGPVQPERIQAVISQVINRHEILRTSFEMQEGELIQRIHPKLDFHVEFTEIGAPFSDGAANKGIVEALIHQFIRPYDLKQLPLFRIRLSKLDWLQDTYLLFYDTHHIISDGVSLGIFTKEINDLYAGRILPPVPVQYKDFTLWHEKLLESDFLKAQKEHWLKKFQGEIPVINLPADHQRTPVFQNDGGAVKQWISVKQTAAVNQLARKSQATLYQVLFSVLYVLLARLTGQADLVVGTPTAGRRHADLYHVMGIFVNTLAIRAYPERSKRFRDFLAELSRELLTDFDNQDYPFENLVEDLKIERDISRNPLFDVMFILQNMKIEPVTAANLEISPYEFERKMAQFDLTLTATENEKGIELELNYAAQIFDTRTAERFLEYYLNILARVVQNPEVTIGTVELLAEAERQLLLYGFNATQSSYPRQKTLSKLFEEQVERTPDQPAVVFHDQCLTYRELNIQANCLAGVLKSKGVVSGSLVGIMLERSTDLLASIFGILKAGAAYVPMDPEYPAERLKYMVEDSRALFVITRRRLAVKLLFQTGADGTKDILLYLEELDLVTEEPPNPPQTITASDLAYVIYTSGSTGEPKGVMVEQVAVHNFIHGMTQKIEFFPGKRILGITTISFDIFGLETFVPLTTGLTIILAGEDEQQDLRLLCELLRKHKVDMIQATPSRMQILVTSAPDLSWLEKATVLMIGGEAFPEKLLRQLTALTGAKIYNMYGPTETTIWSTVQDLTHDTHVNIGAPIANTQIYIVDQDLQLQPTGVAGELCIAGDGLARGYWKRPDLTKEKFVGGFPVETLHASPPMEGQSLQRETSPQRIYRTGDLARWLPDGNIEFLGRIDQQVKVRGYRIELGEIENRLSNHELIHDAAVIIRETEKKDKYLIAYFTAEQPIAIQEVRAYLAEKLPKYMIPSYFMQLQQLPRTPNGKIDRKALPAPDKHVDTGAACQAPQTEIEKMLAAIWQEVLDVENIGVNDNFFDLGGNSLQAMQIIGRLSKHHYMTDMISIMQNPTIAKLQAYIRETPKETDSKPYPTHQNLNYEYHFLQNGEQDPIARILDCNAQMVYLIFKNKIKDYKNYLEMFLQDITFYLVQNPDGTISDIILNDYPTREDILKVNLWEKQGYQTMADIEELLNKGELVVVSTYVPRTPFNRDFEGFDAPFVPSRRGHSFLALAHDSSNLYYVEAPELINHRHFIPYPPNKSIGIIPKEDLRAAFEIFSAYATITIDETRLETNSRLPELLASSNRIYSQEGVCKDGLHISYGKNAMTNLIQLCAEGILFLDSQTNVYQITLLNLFCWKFWMIASKRQLLAHILAQYQGECNTEIRKRTVRLLELLSKEWDKAIQMGIRNYNERQEYLVGLSFQALFIRLREMEDELMRNLERLWG